jgi:hypothetical protein
VKELVPLIADAILTFWQQTVLFGQQRKS